MVRFVLRQDGQASVVEPDARGTAHGRGLWVTARRDIVLAAVEKGAFQRAARRRVVVRPDLVEATHLALVSACREQSTRIARAGLGANQGPAVSRLRRDGARLTGLAGLNTGSEAESGR